MRVLQQYSKSKNITNLNETTQKDYLDSLREPNQQPLPPPDDYLNPYSFADWFNRQIGIIQGSEKQQYDEYLKNWYKNNYTVDKVATDLRTDYTNFVKDLTIVLNKEDKTNWLVDIDYANPLEVEQAIPFWAKKLKEIAIYFVTKRDAIKKAKLKYNMTGATQGLEKLFYEYLLKAFTQRDYVLNIPDQDVWNTLPALSAVKNGFTIEIQELYDNASYFDKNPSLSASEYYTTNDSTVTAYYDSMGVSPSAYEWLFKTGFAELCANNPLFWVVGNLVNSEISLSAIESAENPILNEYLKFKMAKRYLGENQYFVSGGYFIPWSTTVEFDLKQGNNWFYWPSGEYLNDIPTLTIDNIPLLSSSLILDGATGFSNYLSADKIFISYNNIVSGAWLKHTVTNTQNDVMSAKLIQDQTMLFKFPFPGYGLSGNGVDWTGKQLSNMDHEFGYLDETIQSEIKDLYWGMNSSVSSVCAVDLQNSQLINNGAVAGSYYNEGDHISTRVTSNPDKVHDTTPNTVYQGEILHAWLYKMEKTDIPLTRSQNYIHWPISKYDNNATDLMTVLSSQCAPVALSAISLEGFIGSRAGTGLYDSDIIYKLDSRNGTPIECAYLEGTNIRDGADTTFTANATGAVQSSLSLKCKAGEYTTFLWMDIDTPIEDVFIKHVPHQPDCAYLFIDHHSLVRENPADLKDNIDYKEWQKCDCGAIRYSPLGHPGANYDDYRNAADIIFVDTLFPIPFTTKEWIGLDGENYQNSEDFAWFKLNAPDVEPDAGWGKGQWVAGGVPNSTRTFTLKKGYQYKYLRANLGHSQTFLVDDTVPYLIIKQPYTWIDSPQWKKAYVDSNGQWQSETSNTDMVLKAGDYLVYDHIDSNWYCVTSIGTYGETNVSIASAFNLTNNHWLNYTYATSGQTINLAWPNTLFTNGPTALAFQLSAIQWKITPPSQAVLTFNSNPSEILEIYGDRVGTWTVTAIGYFQNGLLGASVTYNNIANFQIVPFVQTSTTSGARTTETIYADTINFTLNIDLSGWNYTTKSYDGISNGARPFWAHASDGFDKITKSKGRDIWGGGIQIVDDYVLLTQPERSKIVLETDTYIEYTPKDSLVWVEPLTFNVTTSSNQWKDLLINTTQIASLSDFLYNLNQEMIVSATDNNSQIVLAQRIEDYPVFVNYWSMNPFKWTQVLTNESLGLPPTGGVFVPVTTGDLVLPSYPYTNLSNRHFPTIATVPHVEELYTTEDVGGYFIPRLLGTSTFLSKINNSIITTDHLLTNYDNRGLSAVYRDINIYTTDQGLTQSDQITPVSSIAGDASWMKGNVTEGKLAGQITDPVNHQEFIPYQTRYETQKMNHIGLRQQGDAYDPWTKELDSTWSDPISWPSDFKKQYNLEPWKTQFVSDKQVWNWKTDIFNNQYSLLKTLSGQSIYEKRQAVGDLWIRTYNNIVQPASSVLSALYIDYTILGQTPPLSAEIFQIKDFDIFYDTLLIQTENYIVLNKILFDFETGLLDFDINNIHVINLQENGNQNKYGGTWFFENNKTVTLSVLVSTTSAIYPRLYELDLNTNRLKYIYNTSTIETNMLSALHLNSLDNPVFTYNNTTQTYNMSFICHSQDYNSFLLGKFFITDSGDEHTLKKVSVITPLK